MENIKALSTAQTNVEGLPLQKGGDTVKENTEEEAGLGDISRRVNLIMPSVAQIIMGNL